jgi:hypothetical protein
VTEKKDISSHNDDGEPKDKKHKRERKRETSGKKEKKRLSKRY